MSKTNKFKVKLPQNMMKIILSIFGVIAVVAILALFLGYNAYPGNPLYFADRGIERMYEGFMYTPDQKLTNQTDLAEERLNEMKQSPNDPNVYKSLLEDYKQNLAKITELFKIQSESNVSEEDLYSTVSAINIKTDRFERILIARKKEIEPKITDPNKKKEVSTELNQAISKTRSAEDEIFDVAIRKIKNNSEFKSYVKNQLTGIIRAYGKEVQYAEQDIAAWSAQATSKEEDKKYLADSLNVVRDRFAELRDDVGMRDNLELYLDLKEFKKQLDDLSHKIVDTSQKYMQKAPEPTATPSPSPEPAKQ